MPSSQSVFSDIIYDVQAVSRDHDSALFALVRQFLRARYQQEHQALLRDFLPQHLVWGLNSGSPVASVGLQNARQGELFLEQYLDQPVERCASQAVGHEIRRDQIVEVGNLACQGGFSRQLILSLTKSFYQQGIEWVAFTATTRVGAGFQRLGMTPVKLAAADPHRIANSDSEWGQYYQLQPTVFVGCVAQGVKALNANPVTARAFAAVPVVALPEALLGCSAAPFNGLAAGACHG